MLCNLSSFWKIFELLNVKIEKHENGIDFQIGTLSVDSTREMMESDSMDIRKKERKKYIFSLQSYNIC